jgi:serine/threonine protein kinase
MQKLIPFFLWSLIGCVTTPSREPFPLQKKQALYPRQFPRVSPFTHATQVQQKKALLLQKKIQTTIGMDFPLESLEKTLFFVDTLRQTYQFSRPIYIHPDEARLFFPFQLYPNGHGYLQLGEWDPDKKSGTYKIFSHALDYDSLIPYANLTVKIEKQHMQKEVTREVHILRSLAHSVPVPKIRDAGFTWGESREGPLFSMQMDLFSHDLSERKNENSSVLPLLQLALQAIEAVRALHEKAGWIHRDLKPKNFFWRKEGSIETLVVADFGLAEKQGVPTFGKGLVGTRAYLAPELPLNRLLKGKSCESISLCQKSDGFSLGVTILTVWGQERELALKKAVSRLHDPLSSKIIPPANVLRARLREYTHTHAAYYISGNLEYEKHPEEAARLDFSHILWGLTHPDPVIRLSLAEAESQLKEILERYKTSMNLTPHRGLHEISSVDLIASLDVAC